MKEYQVKMRDHGKLKKRFLYFLATVVIILIIAVPILIKSIDLAQGGFIFLFVGTFLLFILSILVALKSIKNDTPIQVNQDAITSKHYGVLKIVDIAAVEIPINYNGHHSLLILTMKSGKIYSVNVLNKYNGFANDEFDRFVSTFKKVLKMNNLEIKN